MQKWFIADRATFGRMFEKWFILGVNKCFKKNRELHLKIKDKPMKISHKKGFYDFAPQKTNLTE